MSRRHCARPAGAWVSPPSACVRSRPRRSSAWRPPARSKASKRRRLAGMEDPTTEELRLDQLRREMEEKQRAEESEQEHDTATHDRRAMKAEYLRAKLEQRAEAERAASDEDDDA